MTQIKSKVLQARPAEGEKLPLSLSVSKIKTFSDCKAKYRFNYIEKLPQKDWEFLTFGKFLHEILENFYKKLMDGSQDPPNVILTLSWKESFANWNTKISKDQKEDAKQICIQFLKQFTEEKQPPTIIGVEKSFFINIDDRVLLNGFIDRVQIDYDDVLHVSDYKTTKNKKYLKNDFFQLLTYAFVMCLENPNLQKVRTSYILLRHNFEKIIKTFKREEIMSIESKFLAYADSIEAERLFRPTPNNLCKFCSFLEACDAGSRMMGITDTSKFGEESW